MQASQTILASLGQGQRPFQPSVVVPTELDLEPLSDLESRAMDRLFIRMNSNYRHLWSSSFPDETMVDAAKLEWGQALRGLDLHQIRRGIERCFDKYPKPPTMTEFVRCCRMASLGDYGMPEPEKAYQEVCQNAHSPGGRQWSHPVVYHAGRAVGWMDLHGNTLGAKRRFEDEYREIAMRVMGGEVLASPQIKQASGRGTMISSKRTEGEKQKAQQCCNELLQGLRRRL